MRIHRQLSVLRCALCKNSRDTDHIGFHTVSGRHCRSDLRLRTGQEAVEAVAAQVGAAAAPAVREAKGHHHHRRHLVAEAAGALREDPLLLARSPRSRSQMTWSLQLRPEVVLPREWEQVSCSQQRARTLATLPSRQRRQQRTAGPAFAT